jgi:predicted dienelactone hydrolase
MKTFVAMTLLLLAATASQAQSVWRCGPDGRSFSDAPCKEGRELNLPQARPAADLDSAQAMAQREKALAAQLVRERQQREAVTMAGAAGIHGTRLVKAPEGRAPRAQQPKAKQRHRLEALETSSSAASSSRRTKG